MIIKNYLYLSFLVLLFNGCSYKLVSTEEFTTMNTRLEEIEKNISESMSKELDLKLNQHDEKLQSFVKESFAEQNATLQSHNNELITLIKSENLAKSKRTQRAPVITKTVVSDGAKLVVGRVEKVHIYPSDLVMNARIDTGAETSSINAEAITEFERDGKKWVRFTLFDEKTNAPYIMERRVIRRVRILQSSQEDGYEKRVVVTLKITIGDKKELSEFTLTSREHMQFPILIGRNVLQDLIIVDVSEKYIAPLVPEKENEFKK